MFVYCICLYILYLYIYFIDVNLDKTEIESIEWLKRHQAPWELVVQHWSKTFNIRSKNIKSSNQRNLINIFTEWPILKHPNGYFLILEDFKCMNLSKETLSMDKWENFFQRIRSRIPLSHKDDTVNILLETLEDKDIANGKEIFYQ